MKKAPEKNVCELQKVGLKHAYFKVYKPQATMARVRYLKRTKGLKLPQPLNFILDV